MTHLFNAAMGDATDLASPSPRDPTKAQKASVEGGAQYLIGKLPLGGKLSASEVLTTDEGVRYTPKERDKPFTYKYY